MKQIKLFFLLFLLTILPLNAYPWGMKGHYIAGEITDKYLTARAKKKIEKIFSNATVAQMSVWGDFMRSDNTFKDKDKWHYTNIEEGISKDIFEQVVTGREQGENVYRVGWLIQQLKNNPKDTVSLKLLIHLVQDLHCPMHLARPTDRGGNSVQITWFGQKTNLHSLWDSFLIDSQQMSYSEYSNFIYRTTAPKIPLTQYKEGMEIEWAWEIYQITEQIYRDVAKIDRHYEYIFQYKETWEKCLAEAGVHLAAILNFLYK